MPQGLCRAEHPVLRATKLNMKNNLLWRHSLVNKGAAKNFTFCFTLSLTLKEASEC